MLRRGIELDRGSKKWDSISSRVVNNFVRCKPSQSSILLEALKNRYKQFDELTMDAAKTFSGQFSMLRLWNASIVGSILFGMVMMTFVYRYLGQGAKADQIVQPVVAEQQIEKENIAAVKNNSSQDAEAFAEQLAQIQEAQTQQALENKIGQMVKGYPIEKMVPYIAEQDQTVAAFIVAIARKESGWGVHVPVLNGQDCYNYWGYRGKRVLMGSGGHTCFNSPKDAVETVAKRINTLVDQHGITTSSAMVKIWKCGGNCAATGGQAAANKWASDVESILSQFETQDSDQN
jgi:hypothetical protein